MPEDIISNNLTTEYRFSNEELNCNSMDHSDEDNFYFSKFEENFFSWEQETEAAIEYAKQLLNKSNQEVPQAVITLEISNELNSQTDKPNLAYECVEYLLKQHNEAFKGRINIHGIPLAKAELRADWDQKFFNFIRSKIWEYLKMYVVLKESMFPPDTYNKTANAIFEAITPEIYSFASKIIKNLPSRFLGY